MDEPDEEKNNEIDKNATDPTDLEKNEDTQHLDELSKISSFIFFHLS